MCKTEERLRRSQAWRRPNGRVVGRLLLCLLASFPATALGQGPPVTRAQELTFHQQTTSALAHGQVEDAETLAASRAADDPAAAAVRARILISRGRYEAAEELLVPIAAANPRSDAALELGLLRMRLGRKTEAFDDLARVLQGAAGFRQAVDLYRAGLAARALDEFRQANTYLRRAAGLAAGDAAIRVAWGDLFLEKYNYPDAVQSFSEAVEIDDQWAPAHLGLARALAGENPPGARAAAERALSIDPSYVAAHLLVAELALDEGNRDEGHAAIERALGVNPSSLEARALLAATAYVDDRPSDFEAEVSRALALNPVYGDVYRIAGSLTARNYRFEEAVALVRKAIELEPDNTRAYAELGMHLLRTGDEPAAREALERSFAADPFDVVTFNLLTMLDTLEGFETIRTEEIWVRLDRDEAPMLKEYVVLLAEEALSTLSARYNFSPQGPILIEIFPKHDDFAVRNLGLPGMIGALGACFGRVVTMDSPRARPPGTFNWQATLWHELAHVITLQMSNQRVPRWLTEGISVYEEGLARPEWGRDQEIAFANALNEDRVLKLRDLNAGFTRPDTISLAYYEASVLVEHLVTTHGEQALRALLRAYGEGLDTEDALKQAIGRDLDNLQASFDVALEERFGALRRALQSPEDLVPGPAAGERVATLRKLAAENPGSYGVQLALGLALHAAGELDEAVEVLERAAELVPMATGAESPHVLLADIAVRQGDRERAMRELEALLGYDHQDIESARRLAALAEEAGDQARMQVAYERIVGIDPFEANPHGALGRLALERGDYDLATREFRIALAIGPVDPVAAHCDLAESYLLAGQPEEAKREALAALEIAPTYERAQEVLLKVVEGRGR